MITQTETQVITLTAPQLKALAAAVLTPSIATVHPVAGRYRHTREDVAVLCKHELTRFLPGDPLNFVIAPKGEALFKVLRTRAIEHLQARGWFTRATTGGVRGVILVTPNTHEQGLYLDEAEAWDSLMTGELLAAVQS